MQAAAMDALSSMASLVLASFPTTVEQDVQEAQATSDADLQLAVRFRIEKKQVLLGAISAMSQRIKVRWFKDVVSRFCVCICLGQALQVSQLSLQAMARQ